jgi:hypothetical protein
MSRKQLVLIAETIRVLCVTSVERALIADDFARMCARHNSAFNYARFMTACGVIVS